MSMTFYYTPMSSATRVHWALEELGVPYEKVKMNLAEGDHKKPDYLKLNPNGKIPLLVVDGLPIFESFAQLLYLGETYGVEKGLYPKPGLERADALRWMVWASVSIHENIVRIIKNGERVPEEERNAKAREAAMRDVTAQFAILDQHLEGRSYVLGGSFSLADCAIVSYAMFAGRLGVDTAGFKNIAAWVSRCMPRAALARAMQG